jgi:S-DNA-T family DNA segregation ATPase FtsK/SpoIIIE
VKPTAEVAPRYPHTAPITADNRYRLEVCRTADGTIGSWDLNSQTPHALVTGEDAVGRTDAQVVTAISALRRGFRVRIADPSRVEFAALRRWPGVQVARTVGDMVTLVDQTYSLMLRRQKRQDVPLTPEILILDQWPQLHALTTKLWRSHSALGEHPMMLKVSELLFLGRQTRVHLLLGIPQPSARTLPRIVQDNAKFRLTLGRLSPEGAHLMWHSPTVGTGIADRTPGHGTVHTPLGAAEAQVYRLPILNLDVPAMALSDQDATARRELFRQVAAAQGLQP